ncbi:MAG: efflux RND transporter permease subunit [Erythrobacter sp.]|nr:efflux RND transporter permease subunit [Erythrobacter sp.]
MKIPNLSALAVREQSVTLFLVLLLLGSGLFAFLKLGRAEDPSFTVKVMTISALWPGASAEEMRQQVADPLEKRLQELAFFDRVESRARPGRVDMTLVFRDFLPPSQVPEQFYQARKKMGDEALRLPRGVIGPIINDEYSDKYFSLYALQASGMPQRDLAQIAEDLRQRYLSIPGVEKVKIIGEQPQRIFVEPSVAKLASLGLSPAALVASLQSQNLVTPAGAVSSAGPNVEIRLSGAFADLETIINTPVAVGDRSFRIGDVAEVRHGYEDPPSYLARHNGKPALIIGVIMKKRWNGTVLGEELSAETEAITAELPAGMTLMQVADQSRNIDKAYGEFMLKFAAALAVVLVVSFVALGLRVGLVVAFAVPLTLAGVFIIMLMTGRDFDRITLGALILSLGLLVDDAIIAIEMMVVKMEEGLDRIAAATYAWGATAAPMLTGTLVTVIGFLPIGFAQSSSGEYAGNIFWVVAFSLLVSWVVAVYFTPYLGVKLLPRIEPVEGGHGAIYATPRYRQLRDRVATCVDSRRLVVGVTFGALVLSGILLAVVVPKQFFPSSDRPEVLVEVYMPTGTDIAATRRVVEAIEADIRPRDEARFVDSYIGAGAPRFFLSLNPEQPDPAFAKLVILTRDADARDSLIAFIRNQVSQGAYPAARVRVQTLLFGPPVPYPVTFRLAGPDLDVLRDLGHKLAAIMRSDPGTRDVNTDWGPRAPSLRLELDQSRLRQLGLDPAGVAQQVSMLTSGAVVSQARLGNRTVDVVVRTPPARGQELSSLRDLPIRTPGGGAVPLSGIGELTPVQEEGLIISRNRQPTLTVRSDVAPGLQPPDVTAALLPQFQEFIAALPPGYSFEVGGSVEESSRATEALVPLFPIMAALMLIMIMFQTRSFVLTALVFATAPLGLIGAVPALLITGSPFGFNAILGLIGLAGILMRNTLILVDQIEIEKRSGADDRTAVIEATVRRARPVILTALAAILAFFPLTLSSFWGPLAVVLIGGTIIGTVLTLFFLPALYATMVRVGREKPSGAVPEPVPAV